MARRRRTSADDPFADLAKKVAILEQELSVQREAMERLKELAVKPGQKILPAPPVRRSA